MIFQFREYLGKYKAGCIHIKRLEIPLYDVWFFHLQETMYSRFQNFKLIFCILISISSCKLFFETISNFSISNLLVNIGRGKNNPSPDPNCRPTI